ncbi:MAG: 16S rRNA (uracil(1498)-N(3))-methyltransferase [Rhodospirillales bacterium]
MSDLATSPRIFVDAGLAAGDLVLDADRSHYLIRVMRRKPGDVLRLFNGRDGEWSATVDAADKRACRLAVKRQTRSQADVPDIWHCFAPIKKSPLDYLVEKATELGVRRLCPVLTDRTENRRVNTGRLAEVAREAAEQCECLAVPAIAEPVGLAGLLAAWPAGRTLFFLDETRDARPLAAEASARAGCPAALITGPEGGFTPAERRLLLEHPTAVPCSLGPRLLRAETAAAAALAIWQSVAGDLAD